MGAGEAPLAAAAKSPSISLDAPLAGPALTPVAVERLRRGFYLAAGKRIIDVVLGTLLVVALAPLGVLVAATVLVTSGWPVLYASPRIGMDGRPFRMWKFRTMVRDADALAETWADHDPRLAAQLAADWKLPDDPRMTRLGRLLRKSSLDELPNFLNVLRGEMSLVGPRPYLTREVLDPGLARAIVSVRPGITGPFQVRGRNDLSPVRRMAIEAEYWRDAALLRDLVYLARTVSPLIRMDGH